MTKEEIREAAQDWDGSGMATPAEVGAFIKGAEWMQERMQETNEGQALLYAVEKTAERTKREMIKKAVEWLDNELMFRDHSSGRGSFGEVKSMGGYDSLEEFIDEFKQAMQDESK